MLEANTVNDSIQTLAILCIIIIGAYIYKKLTISYRAKNKITNPISRALIMFYYTKGYDLKLATNDSINGMNYSIFITTEHINLNPEEKADTYADPGATIYNLILPFNTNAHIVGLSKKYAISSTLIGEYMLSNDLEQISLEGSFSDDFSIYARRGQGSITQYILDPAAMAFITDYCKNNFWEIYNNKMYIVSDPNQSNGMLFLDTSLEFVRQIKPALLKNEITGKNTI